MIYGALGQLELKESRFCWKTSKSFYQNLKLRLDLQKGVKVGDTLANSFKCFVDQSKLNV